MTLDDPHLIVRGGVFSWGLRHFLRDLLWKSLFLHL